MSANRTVEVSCRWLPRDVSDGPAETTDGAQKTAMKVCVDRGAQVLQCYGHQRRSGSSLKGDARAPSLLQTLSLGTASACLHPGSDRTVSLWAGDSEVRRIAKETLSDQGVDGTGQCSPAAEVEGTYQFKCADGVEAATLLDKLQQAGCIMRGFRRRYDIKEQVGYGGFSKVFSAVDRLTGATVGIKVCSRISEMAHPLREALLIRQLQHPSLLEFKGVYQIFDPELLQLVGMEGDRTWALVTDLLSGKELHEVALTKELGEGEAKLVFRRLLSAMERVHQQGIVHRDVKPENVVITSSGLKLIDFGLACHEHDSKGMGLKVGSAGYVAPELFHGGKEDRTFKMDCFALGATLYFMLCGRSPFKGDSLSSTWANNIEGNINMEPLKGVSPEATDLIVQLMKTDHEERPSAHEALQHPWLVLVSTSAPASPHPSTAGSRLGGFPRSDVDATERPRSDGVFEVLKAVGSGCAAARSKEHQRLQSSQSD